MELQRYLEVLWRSKWLILAAMTVTTIVAIIGSMVVTPLYSATTTLRLASAPGGSSDYIYVSTLTRLSNTYVEIANSDITLNQVADRLGMDKQPKVEVELVPETELIRIKATDPDPEQARDIATMLANILVEQSQQLYGSDTPTASQILEGQLEQAKIDLDFAMTEYDNALRKASSSESGTPAPNTNTESLARLLSVRQQIYTDLLQKYETARTSEQLRANALSIVEPAIAPEKPSSPKLPINIALGLLGGFVLALILAFLFEAMDDTLRGVEDVRQITSLPILCMIPNLTRLSDLSPEPMFSGNNHLSVAPAFDQLRARILFKEGKQKASVFLITSPEPGAGKSTVSANLAVSLSKGGSRVILIDMDLHRPRQHSIMKLPNETGLSNFMRNEIELEEAVLRTPDENLSVVVAGSNPHVPPNWYTSEHIGALLKELAKGVDYILIDTPALLSVADPTVFASQADAVILVVARRKTERQNLRFALHILDELKVNILGIVMNKMPDSQLYRYYSVRQSHHPQSWREKIVHRIVNLKSRRSNEDDQKIDAKQ